MGFKLEVKIGEHHFRAEGIERNVRDTYEHFLIAIAGYQSRGEKPADEPVHGLTCIKAPHDNPGGGYLHDETDDSPYDVDGLTYCGRCHRFIPGLPLAGKGEE